MTKVIVAGAAGRMGRRICAMVQQQPGLELVAGFERPDSPEVGSDLGELAGLGTLGIKMVGDPAEALDQGEVVIDFTFHEATMKLARLAAAKGKAMVIGTTGLTTENLDDLRNLAADAFPCVQAPNMAVGVNVLFKVARKMAAVLGNSYDIEIVEAHHRMKKDAPSGTALKLGEMVAEGVGRDLEKVGVYARHGIIGERTDQEIGIQTIRAGDIVGEHTVYFAGAGERLELTHRAHNRDNFARGAALAAAWVVDKPKGLYNMFDVLGLEDF
ncbi:4-hydroxy-tetrahydrodipicolinate reductase [Desulfurivibrio dismutans]|uniref:4-hydroxy-tetrahydrodipicolinate reductase n=1 Tax=Desulfurivibrio dismutans TaxID=1398908 RepID=UPI0023DA1CD3|nr:4-hydroxy-tetrahydrodipicolinate reductase [Desulfurivibrio alkaliphilus]MDF1613817.1 4-hydroxy-tetrahydrodipicolinate reductase [Desulfurivibrio alkaliphilus]